MQQRGKRSQTRNKERGAPLVQTLPSAQTHNLAITSKCDNSPIIIRVSSTTWYRVPECLLFQNTPHTHTHTRNTTYRKNTTKSKPSEKNKKNKNGKKISRANPLPSAHPHIPCRQICVCIHLVSQVQHAVYVAGNSCKPIPETEPLHPGVAVAAHPAVGGGGRKFRNSYGTLYPSVFPPSLDCRLKSLKKANDLQYGNKGITVRAGPGRAVRDSRLLILVHTRKKRETIPPPAKKKRSRDSSRCLITDYYATNKS